MRKETGRTRRIGELLQRELASIIPRVLNDPRVALVTITAVDVAPDLSHAKVFVTHLSGKDKAVPLMKALKNSGRLLRHELSGRVALRVVPELRFVYDESVERGAQLSELIDRAVRDEREPDR